jgi:methylated-DNA-[protein]-cysteine S-methyltransferase
MGKNIKIQYYQSPFGSLVIGAFEKKLVLCDWQYRKMRTAIDQRICKQLQADFIEESDVVIEETIQQLQAYFNKQLKVFSIPLNLVGSPFQVKVWNALLHIDYGTTSTYLQQAIKLENKEAIRAVATANGANAISIIVPCHRIIGTDGGLVGYAGGLPTKQKLLALEGAKTVNNKLQMQIAF